MQILVKMEWNQLAQKWLMKVPNGNPDGRFLVDIDDKIENLGFWDCGNINKLFDDQLDKDKSKWFELNIRQRSEVNG
jgi:hypothetical protein